MACWTAAPTDEFTRRVAGLAERTLSHTARRMRAFAPQNCPYRGKHPRFLVDILSVTAVYVQRSSCDSQPVRAPSEKGRPSLCGAFARAQSPPHEHEQRVRVSRIEVSIRVWTQNERPPLDGQLSSLRLSTPSLTSLTLHSTAASSTSLTQTKIFNHGIHPKLHVHPAQLFFSY